MKAFPSEHSIPGTLATLSDGMDLRDYFAAKSMQAMIGNNNYLATLKNGNESKQLADDAYVMADLMMEARGQ